MKVLKIENNEGYLELNDNSIKVTQVTKENIFDVLKLIYNNDQIEFDELTEDSPINNEAQRIVYDNMYEYLTKFNEEKQKLKDEVRSEFEDVINKYKLNIDISHI
ncbi:MAG: hypothetical protein IJP71_06525 [Lachnospiraceae bacterium]|nr:hypothetical protein [Lachnospiraceae bacterium]